VTQTVDSDVLRRFAAGEDSAFAEVYRRYCAPMFSVALRTLGRRDLAADAVQQAFVKAWRAAATYSPESDIAPWLFTITHRTAIDLWRSERHHGLLETGDEAVDEVVAGPSMVSAWEAWQVRRAIDELPADERDVVFLAYIEGLTHTEVSARLAIPVGTVKSRSHRAHRRLTEMLGHLAEDEAAEGGA